METSHNETINKKRIKSKQLQLVDLFRSNSLIYDSIGPCNL